MSASLSLVAHVQVCPADDFGRREQRLRSRERAFPITEPQVVAAASEIRAVRRTSTGLSAGQLIASLPIMSSQVQTQPRDRILAIEPDPVPAATLRRLLGSYVCADFEIVQSIDEAIQSLTERVPDLILTSTFLRPSDEAALTARLKELPASAHLQVITIPHFIDFEDAAAEEPSNVLDFVRRRSVLARPVCDPRSVRDQIEHYLERARAGRVEQTRFSGTPFRRRLTSDDIYTLTNGVGPRTRQAGRVHAANRRQAPRRSSVEVPWLTAVQLPSGVEVNVVNISRHGVLLESLSKITPGTIVDLRFLGRSNSLSVPARIIRSEVAAADRRGVTYRVAAAFDRDVDFGVREAQSTRVSV